MRVRQFYVLWSYAVALALLSVPQRSVAQTPSAQDAAAAETLFKEALALQERGQWRAACTRFEASYKLDPATGTLHNLADCHAKEGRIASAWAAYRRVADEAEHAINLRRLRMAREQAAALEVRLPKLVVHMAKEAQLEGLRVTKDGTVLDSTLLSTPLPVDPGVHTIRAEAPGHAAWSTEVHVGERDLVEVPIPALQRVAEPSVAESAVLPQSALPEKPIATADDETVRQSRTVTGGVTVVVNQTLPQEMPAPRPLARQIVSGVFGAVGVAGVVVGAVYWKARGKRLHDARQFCDGGLSECEDEQGPQLIDDAKKFEIRAIVSWSLAGVGTALCLALWPWGSLQRPAPRVKVSAGLGSLQLSGRF
jgi:hypothetical protein